MPELIAVSYPLEAIGWAWRLCIAFSMSVMRNAAKARMRVISRGRNAQSSSEVLAASADTERKRTAKCLCAAAGAPARCQGKVPASQTLCSDECMLAGYESCVGPGGVRQQFQQCEVEHATIRFLMKVTIHVHAMAAASIICASASARTPGWS